MDIDGFVDNIFENLRSKSAHENVIFCPYSILISVLCRSQGETRDQMAKISGIDADSSKVKSLVKNLQPIKSAGVEIKTYNSLFPARDYKVKKEYIYALQSFGCQVEELSYKSETDRDERARAINDLVAQFTKDNLKSVASLDEMTKILLASLVYFKAPWDSKFD